MKQCVSCELMERRESDNAPLWDDIYQASFWSVVHCNSTSYLGWLILIARRHVAAIDELTDGEASELGILIQQVSRVLKQHTHCIKTYIVQFAESPGHQHVHFHIVPRMANQSKDDIGGKIFRHLGVSLEDRVSEEEMNSLALKVRHSLSEIRS